MYLAALRGELSVIEKRCVFSSWEEIEYQKYFPRQVIITKDAFRRHDG